MITANQLVAHMFGDYVLQSDWMAQQKTQRFSVAFIHAATYALPFLALCPSLPALAVIVLTHAVIDRWRIARFVCWAKNLASPRGYRYPWHECAGTGYHHARPVWLSTGLLILTDNVLHILINGAALKWL